MRIVFSKDRAAQLDLLLTSLERHAPPEPTVIVYRASTWDYLTAYDRLWHEHPGECLPVPENVGPFGGFQVATDRALAKGGEEFVTFFCDDDVLYESIPRQELHGRGLLCSSLRLGGNTTVQYPSNLRQRVPDSFVWRWRQAELDFAYPGSLDGHTFRTSDVRRMLAGRSYPNPTALECALVEGCNELAAERPLMACYPTSRLVGIPVNRVSEQSGVRHGGSLIYSAENLNRSYLEGLRLDLDAIDFTRVDGAHTELDLSWQLPIRAEASG